MNFLLPTGIGDSAWAMFKIQAVARAFHADEIKVLLACPDPNSKIETRAVDFVRRFKFIRHVECRPYKILRDWSPVTPEGYWNYIDDGFYEFKGEAVVALMPNAALERGIRLEQWLPQYSINWDIFKDFRISWWEKHFAQRLSARIGKYAVFYLGPMTGNTTEGHNRGGLWRPYDWVDLGRRIHREFGLQIVVVGAEYDSLYSHLMVYPLLDGDASYWTNLIGRTGIGELFSVTSNAEFLISYQAGVGIVSTYLGVPTGIFWRPKGNTIVSDGYLSFEEGMASAWVPPDKMAAHLPLIYGRDGVDSIMEQIRARSWA